MKRNLEFLKPKWQEILKDEFEKPYMEEIRTFLKDELNNNRNIYPPLPQVFRVFSLVDYDEVKVVILGQDPYHQPGQANGLAFAVREGIAKPPSLQNIFKEIKEDLQTVPSSPSLEGWAKQGVFLLNTVLTVRANEPLSHRQKGWEFFTDRVIELLNEREKPMVFILWGSQAQSKGRLITNPQHLVLKAPHPSPLSAHRGFLGCKHFSLTNEFLGKIGYKPVDWKESGHEASI
jgi:uracil-DNA glycosylase